MSQLRLREALVCGNEESRLKAGCSKDWLLHKEYGN
jgi:hypothetical protein